MREVEFVREPIRRKPESRADQRRRSVRKQMAIFHYMRQGVTRNEAEELFHMFGIYAPNRRFRR